MISGGDTMCQEEQGVESRKGGEGKSMSHARRVPRKSLPHPLGEIEGEGRKEGDITHLCRIIGPFTLWWGGQEQEGCMCIHALVPSVPEERTTPYASLLTTVT